MRMIIYGVGKGYFDFFAHDLFIVEKVLDNTLEVVGISDGNQNVWGNEIIYNKQKFKICKIEEFQDIDYIIVTSKKYFDEIAEELIKKGYRKEQILLIDKLYEFYLANIFQIDKLEGKNGIEIGGPTGLFHCVYNKCQSCDNVNFSKKTVWWEDKTQDFRYEDRVLGKIWILEATNMYQIEDEKYDFVLSSNNLEHTANPLKALKEFTRIVKTGGMILVIVPMKERTFDHNREYTEFEHLLEDYERKIGEDDLSHLSDIIDKHDYVMDPACGGKEKFIERSMKNIENRCLHHHVFDEKCLRSSFEFVGLEVIDFKVVKNNWLIIGEKMETSKI